jgi:hypothetical protein
LRDVLVFYFKLKGHGIFAVDDELWKLIRKRASLIFNTKSFRLFVETVFVNENEHLTKKLDECAVTLEPVNFHDLFARFTLDTFGFIGFGVN